MNVQDFSLKNFALFMQKKNILSVSISFVIAGMMKEIILKLTNEVILPVKSGKSLKGINYDEFIVLIVNLIIVAYLLFALNNIINFSLNNSIN